MAVDFGTDLSCLADLTAEGRMVTGFMVLAEALIRRWTTPRGMLLRFPNYGTDVRENLNEDVDALSLERIRAELRAEALKDERVHECTIVEASTLAEVIATGVVRVKLSIEVADGAVFPLTIDVSAAKVAIVGVE